LKELTGIIVTALDLIVLNPRGILLSPYKTNAQAI
ncbi:MAG: hypothetical protein ACI8ZO_000663, partial [Flavobacteriales bacterium]